MFAGFAFFEFFFENYFQFLKAISSLVKAAYKVAVDQGGAVDEKGTPQTFILSPVFQNMVTELIKTSDRFLNFFGVF